MTLTYVVPIMFIITVPAQALTGRIDPSFTWVALSVGIISVIAASLFWRFGLRYYTGASA
jgi:ABC-2 type transport system permease protein